MNLTSCSNCGTVIDQDQLTVPDIEELMEGDTPQFIAVWINRTYVPVYKCPSCGEFEVELMGEKE